MKRACFDRVVQGTVICAQVAQESATGRDFPSVEQPRILHSPARGPIGRRLFREAASRGLYRYYFIPDVMELYQPWAGWYVFEVKSNRLEYI